MRINRIDLKLLIGEERPAGNADAQPQGNPIHLFPEDRRTRQRPSYGAPASGRYEEIYLELGTDSGIDGCYGPIDAVAARVIDRQFRELLMGADALAGELQWDRLFRSDRHSRHGHVMMAISVVDNALWDVRGRYFGVPVYQLLGGATRDSVPAYASVMGVSHERQQLGEVARRLRDEGYRGLKWFTSHGPGEGVAGLKKNTELAVNVREAVGDHTDIMFDAFMSWDRDFARQWLRGVEAVGPSWLEEPFGPEMVDAYRDLRSRSATRIAGGEHIYGRWEAQRWLSNEMVDVLQPDPEWCGGISEITKICTLASVRGIPVVPHGHLVHSSLHVAASQSPAVVPMMEYITLGMPIRYHFEQDPPRPVQGAFRLPERPGFGISIDVTKIVRSHVWEVGH